ncbi:MAG: hypothetical protein A2287_09360 [Candidatus Melainabacteria bacterium RIFOXYA12_FULL_32_12]|nr:MAG: hypothetical protein A2255_07540 [Candidatus Melainabacteria bacterium RIFOXYA2_FULL_32_9]OGI31208.1 MAG: hypothetical protein A2287_09360 [Candidatus Melainabacteria bacterium RIFOXYA12_FULL_32_12]
MDNYKIYESREKAGEVLAEEISKLNLQKPYLLAIPRGGIQVAEAIADKLKIHIDPIIVKKLPVPGNPEAGFGAITADGKRVIDEETVSYLGLSEDQINRIANNVMQEIHHRIEVYGDINQKKVESSDVIIVDDGVATGYSLIAAIKSIKDMRPNSVTAAIPVSSGSAYEKFSRLTDHVICPLIERTYFFAVGNYYREWYDLTEEEIKSILKKYRDKYQS